MKKVLVIEDNKDNLKIIEYALNRAGYEVVAAQRGEDGVELAKQKQFYFIIMDINLPGMDGIEATRQIRNSKADGDVPVIAITSYAMAGDRERIMEAGCTGYIEKPIDPISIIEEIHKIIKASTRGCG